MIQSIIWENVKFQVLSVYKTNNYGQLFMIINFGDIMDFIQYLKDFIKPTTVTCNSDLQNHLQQSQMEDQYQAHLPKKWHRVPNFQHLFSPILMVTSNPQMIKGFRFQFGLPLSEYFVTSHSWTIPNSGSVQQNPNPMMMPVQQKPTYTFTTQLVQDIRGQEPQTIMMGKADNEGKVDAIFVRKLHPMLQLKVTGSFQSSNVDQGVMGAELQLQQKDSMSVLKVGQGHWGYSILQRLHPNILGGFQYHNFTTHKMSLWSYGFKAFVRNHSVFANYVGIQKQYNLGYIIPIKKGTQFVAHYRYDEQEKTPTTIIGFKQQYDQSQIVATVNTKGQVSTCLSLKNPSFSLKLCALIDYMKDKYSFGYGITLGQGL